MLHFVKELTTLGMFMGTLACIAYFIVSMYEAFLLSMVPDHRPRWIPRINFQRRLGYIALTSAVGFLITFFVVWNQQHKIGYSYFMLIVSAWFFVQTWTRFTRVKKQKLMQHEPAGSHPGLN